MHSVVFRHFYGYFSIRFSGQNQGFLIQFWPRFCLFLGHLWGFLGQFGHFWALYGWIMFSHKWNQLPHCGMGNFDVFKSQKSRNFFRILWGKTLTKKLLKWPQDLSITRLSRLLRSKIARSFYWYLDVWTMRCERQPCNKMTFRDHEK